MTVMRLPNSERFLLLARDEIRLPAEESIGNRDYSAISGPVDWGKVARKMSYYGGLLAAGNLGCTDAEGEWEYDLDTADLTKDEAQIVLHWFASGQGPRITPEYEVTNGRHRLTYCWNAEPNALLPIESEMFMNVAQAPHQDEDFLWSVQCQAKRLADALAPAVQKRNPVFVDQLNQYIDGTRDNSRGHFARPLLF